MSRRRDQSWQIAADLEDASKAIRDAEEAITRCDESVWSEINKIDGIEHLSSIAAALQALSDKYQAIADAEPDDRAADELRTGFREEDFA